MEKKWWELVGIDVTSKFSELFSDLPYSLFEPLKPHLISSNLYNDYGAAIIAALLSYTLIRKLSTEHHWVIFLLLTVINFIAIKTCLKLPI